MANNNKNWSKNVHTESTHPPKGLFTQDAHTIAETLMRPDVSPKGPESGLKMLTYYINRAGKSLSKQRKQELEKAKELMQEKIHNQ